MSSETPTLLKNRHYGEHTLHLPCFFSFKIECCRLVGDLLFILVHAWKMYEHVIYMMNSPFEGWHMVVTLVWWNKNRDSCPNSTMKFFFFKWRPLGRVTHKSWVQDASRRVCHDANKKSTYNLRTGSIHYVNMGRFSTWSQEGLISAQWRSS